MLERVDYYLDRITMYRLVLYVLIAFLAIASILGFFNILRFSPLAIILSSCFLVGVCWAANKIIAKVFDAPTNIESALITGLILALIITPANSFSDLQFLGWAAVLAMSSKYILALHKKHIFNPAALAVVITSFVLKDSASWWVGTLSMTPFVLIGGLLVIRKLRFEELVWTFFATVLVVNMGLTILKGGDLQILLKELIIDSPFLFFAFIMLTEPVTLPPTKQLKVIYGALVGFFFAPQVKILTLSFTPEMALLLGNIFAYIVSPKQKLLLFLQEKREIVPGVIEFVFKFPQKVSFAPGQYMEWTVMHKGADSRGNRRFFTIASSPTEDVIRLGVKFYDNSSTFKKALYSLTDKTPIAAGQLAGDFTLPKDKTKKLVFVAGGIGITPYRSILSYLLDTKESRDIVLLYSNKNANEIAYRDIFERARAELGIKTVYTITDTSSIPQGWMEYTGRIDKKMIIDEIPDYNERLFYLSGPFAMITAFEGVLKELGVKNNQIKKDFFPGLV